MSSADVINSWHMNFCIFKRRYLHRLIQLPHSHEALSVLLTAQKKIEYIYMCLSFVLLKWLPRKSVELWKTDKFDLLDISASQCPALDSFSLPHFSHGGWDLEAALEAKLISLWVTCWDALKIMRFSVAGVGYFPYYLTWH